VAAVAAVFGNRGNAAHGLESTGRIGMSEGGPEAE
jgi:hypothetical protein